MRLCPRAYSPVQHRTGWRADVAGAIAALRAGLDGVDLEQGVRRMGLDPGGRSDGSGAAGPGRAPVPHRQHPGQQLSDAPPCGAFQGDPSRRRSKTSGTSQPRWNRVMRVPGFSVWPASVAPLPTRARPKTLTISIAIDIRGPRCTARSNACVSDPDDGRTGVCSRFVIQIEQKLPI